MEMERRKMPDMKNTKRRKAVLAVIEKADLPLSAGEIYAAVSANVHMSVSTLYRTLAVMTENGLLLKSMAQDGKTYYQLNRHKHKHHLICTVCHTSVPVDECPLNELEKMLMDKTGFVITGHNLEFSGLCPQCVRLGKFPPQAKKKTEGGCGR